MDQEKYLSIFCDEAREHIDVLQARLVDLEENPRDEEVLKVILRSAHTIKGSARMVGLTAIGELAHRMEDVLKALEQGGIEANADVFTILFHGVDVMAEAVAAMPDLEATKGQITMAVERVQNFLTRVPAPAQQRKNLASALENLFAGPDAPVEPPDEEPPGPVARDAADEPTTSIQVRSDDTSTRSSALDAGADTMRVKVPKIDNLSNLVGELVIAKSKMGSNIHSLARIFDDFREDVTAGLKGDHQARGSFLSKMDRYLTDTCQTFLEHLREDFGYLDLYSEEILSETLNLRLLPASTIFDRYHRLVRDLRQRLKKKITLQISGRDILLDKQILQEINPALLHLIQNAADHGIEEPGERREKGKPEAGTIELNAYHRGGNVVIEVRDDGRGIDLDAVRRQVLARGLVGSEEIDSLSDRDVRHFVFRDGFSTTQIITGTSGRGVGMGVAWEKVQALKGSASVESEPGVFTSIQLVFPPTFNKMMTLLVEVGDQIVCLPTSFLESVAILPAKEVFREGDTPMVSLQGRIMPLVDLAGVLDMPPVERTAEETLAEGESVKIVLARVDDEFIALRVDRIHRIEEVIVKAAGSYFREASLVAGMTILRKGDPSVILNVFSLFGRIREKGTGGVPDLGPAPGDRRTMSVLVVDDSITTRTLEKSILEGAGYAVTVARDAEDALGQAAQSDFDIVITDVEMPGMNGFELTKRLRASVKYRDVPVIIVTSLARDEDKHRGIEVGAQAYIVKGAFQQKTLLDTVRRLIGT